MEVINKSMLRRSDIKEVHINLIEYQFNVLINTYSDAIIAKYRSRDLATEAYNSIEMQIFNEKEFITIENYL